jgi:hypothetical protein
VNKTSEPLSRSDVIQDTSGDNATRAWFVASIIAAVVVVITFTAIWMEQLIAPLGPLRLFL